MKKNLSTIGPDYKWEVGENKNCHNSGKYSEKKNRAYCTPYARRFDFPSKSNIYVARGAYIKHVALSILTRYVQICITFVIYSRM